MPPIPRRRALLLLLAAFAAGCAPAAPKPLEPAPRTRAPSYPLPAETRLRARDLGIVLGELPPGPLNAVTDVPGVRVAHVTHKIGSGKLVPGSGPVRTGATVILPTSDDFWHSKVPAAWFVLNGNGEMTGLHYVKEFGYLETPIVFTNTLSVGRALDGAIQYMLGRFPRIGVDESTVTPIVGECDDSTLNDMRGLHVSALDIVEAAKNAASGPVVEGAVGGGTGMICYELKGGIGTSSRVLPAEDGGFVVGAIVQSNFGRREELRIDGVPVGRELASVPSPYRPAEGSLLVVVATNAPLTSRQLERVARRVTLGVARTGTVSRDGSGDLFLAFATGNRITAEEGALVHPLQEMQDDRLNVVFQGAEESVEEAIVNSLTMASTTDGRDGNVATALPLDRLRELMVKYGRPPRP